MASKIFVITLLLIGILPLSSKTTKQVNKKACFNFPAYLYDDEQGKFYRQDWCKFGKEPVYYNEIPTIKSGE